MIICHITKKSTKNDAVVQAPNLPTLLNTALDQFVEDYKKYDRGIREAYEEKEKAWQRLTSNPKAFLKAQAISHVLASYKFKI